MVKRCRSLQAQLLCSGVLALCLCPQSRSAAQETGRLSIPLRAIGAPLPREVNVGLFGNGDELLWSGHVSPIQETGMISAPLLPGAKELQIRAKGFADTKIPISQAPLGLALEALSSLILRVEPRPKATSGPLAPPVLWSFKPRPKPSVRHARGNWNILGDAEFLLPPGAVLILFDDGQHPPWFLRDIDLPPGKSTSISLANPPRPHVRSFRVEDMSGKPVANATLSSVPRKQQIFQTLMASWVAYRKFSSGSDGNINMDRLPAETPDRWRFEAKEHRPTVISDPGDQPQDDGRPQTVRLRPLPEIHVSVVSDFRIDRDFPLRIVRVDLSSPTSLEELSSRIKGDTVWQGRLSERAEKVIRVERAGTYRVELDIDGQGAYAEARVDDLLTAPDTLSIPVRLSKRRIRGVVKIEGEPQPDVRVEAYPALAVLGPGISPLNSTATTQAGLFELSVLQADRVRIQARPSSRPPKTVSVDLTSGDADDVEVLFTGRLIRIHVTSVATGSPIEGATVGLMFAPKSGTSPLSSTIVTSSDGIAVFSDFAEGQLDVVADAQGFSPRRERRVLAPKPEDDDIDLRLRPETPFRIRVQDAQSMPLAGADIVRPFNLYFSAPRQSPLMSLAVTDSAGEVTFPKLFGEPVPIFVIAKGFQIETGRLPEEAPPAGEEGPDPNVLTFTLTPVRIGPDLLILGPDRQTRKDPVLLFVRDGVEIPLTIFRLYARLTGVNLRGLLSSDASGGIHVQDCFGPGIYAVYGLSPANEKANPSEDVRDYLGMVQLPLREPTQLRWETPRPGFSGH
jgi:hypothetical protein